MDSGRSGEAADSGASSTTTPGATFRILGSLEVWSDGRRLPLGGRHQERALATLLVEAGRSVPVTRLIDAVWGASPPTTATHQMRKIIAQLRRVLGADGGVIITDGPGYRIDLASEQLDALQFEERLDQARQSDDPDEVIDRLRAALVLWRGPALSGLGGPVIAPAAVILEDSRLAAVDELARRRLAQGDARELVGPLRRLLDAHPLRESLRAHLILALYRCGRQAEALTVYDEGRRQLREELGVDPGRELTRLYEAILREDPALAAPELPGAAPSEVATPSEVGDRAVVAATLPYDVPDFTGRVGELSALLTIVPEAARQALTIVTIDGMAGVGKSSLAVHAAHRLAARFPDGQLFLDLHGFTEGSAPLDPLDALDMLLRALGARGDSIPDSLADRSAMWRDRMARQSIVLLLDNAADTAQVRPLMPGSPGSLVIVTSRARVVGLDGAVPISLRPPSPADSLALLTRVLGADRVAAEPEPIQDLIETCGGLPLALRVAAARLSNRPQWSVAYLVSRLRRAERGIDELALDDRSVAAAFRLSYQGLPREHRRLFRLLGLHPCPEFGPLTAAALAGVSGDRAEDMLEDLLDARQLEQRQQDRYTFHNLFRSYARLLVGQEETDAEQTAALLRLYDYALLVIRHATGLIQPSRGDADLPDPLPGLPLARLADAETAYRWLDNEYANVVALVRAAPDLGVHRHAAQMACDLSYYLQVRGHSRTQAELLRAAVVAARRVTDRPLELRSLNNMFVPLWHFGRFAEARECAEAALVVAEELRDLQAQGVALSQIGMVGNSLGQYTDALAYAHRALQIQRRLGNRRQEATVLTSISVAQDALGQHAESLSAAEEALRLERDLGDEFRQLVAMVNIAVAQSRLLRMDLALTTLDEASCLAARVASPLASAILTAQYADVLRRLGRLDDALDHALRAHDELTVLERGAALVDLKNVLGSIRFDRGEYVEALTVRHEALDQARALGIRLDVVRALDGAARAQYALGDVEAARVAWLDAQEQATVLGVPEAAQIAERLGQLD